MESQLKEAVQLFEEVIVYGTERVLRGMDNSLWKDVSPEQLQMLKLIQQEQAMTSSRLAELQGVHKSAISSRLKKLLDKNYVQLIPSSDRREKRMEVTKEGIALIQKADDTMYEVIEQLTKNQFHEKEMEQFLLMFRKLRDLLKQGGTT